MQIAISLLGETDQTAFDPTSTNAYHPRIQRFGRWRPRRFRRWWWCEWFIIGVGFIIGDYRRRSTRRWLSFRGHCQTDAPQNPCKLLQPDWACSIWWLGQFHQLSSMLLEPAWNYHCRRSKPLDPGWNSLQSIGSPGRLPFWSGMPSFLQEDEAAEREQRENDFRVDPEFMMVSSIPCSMWDAFEGNRSVNFEIYRKHNSGRLEPRVHPHGISLD